MRRRELDRALRAVGTLQGLARRLGVTPGTLRKWIRSGVPRPKRERAAVRLRPGDEVTLQEAINRVGAAAVARSFGVSARTVKRWTEEGIPTAREQEAPSERVERLLREIREAASRSLAEEQTFNELLKLAGEATVTRTKRSRDGKTSRVEVAAMPRVKTTQGPRVGKLTAGYQWVKGFRRELTEDVIAEIEAWSHTLIPKRGYSYPLWQATALLAQYALSPSKQFNAGQRTGSPKPLEMIVRLPNRNWGNFNIEMPVFTPAGRKRDVVRELVRRLENIEEDELLRSYVYSVRFVNYRRRTKKEQSAFETKKRRERTKKVKR
jgi:predicted site-specific integrase-resolvase